MKEVLKKYLDRLADYYKEIEQELRYDGNRVNNFASLILCKYEERPDYKKIKQIRKNISKETPWFSSFRGDALNMISILLSLDNDWENTFDKIRTWEEILREDGFKDSPYLAMSSWVLSRCTSEKDDVDRIKDKIKEVYSFISNNYGNITSGEDYLACVFISLTDVGQDEYEMILKSVLYNARKKDYTTSNGAQSLANVFTTDIQNFENDIQKAEDIILKSKEIGFAIPSQYMAIPGIASMYIDNESEFIEKVQEASEYLTNFDEYTFFMDKSFRYILAMVIVMYSYNVNDIILDPIIAVCITNELEGQAKSLICTTL